MSDEKTSTWHVQQHSLNLFNCRSEHTSQKALLFCFVALKNDNGNVGTSEAIFYTTQSLNFIHLIMVWATHNATNDGLQQAVFAPLRLKLFWVHRTNLEPQVEAISCCSSAFVLWVRSLKLKNRSVIRYVLTNEETVTILQLILYKNNTRIKKKHVLLKRESFQHSGFESRLWS